MLVNFVSSKWDLCGVFSFSSEFERLEETVALRIGQPRGGEGEEDPFAFTTSSVVETEELDPLKLVSLDSVLESVRQVDRTPSLFFWEFPVFLDKASIFIQTNSTKESFWIPKAKRGSSKY